VYPVLFELFGFQVSTFGLMVAVAFLVGGWLAGKAFASAGLEEDFAWRILTACVIGGLLGSKLWFVGEHMVRDPDPVFADLLLSRGGLTWYGGLVGGTLFGLARARSLGIPLLQAANCAAPTLAVGQAIGRIGCFLVGDDYGVKTDLPWGVAFPQGLPPTEVPVHPTMLYEMLWLFPSGALLWSRRARSPFLFGEYLMLAGSGRLWIEGLRENPGLVGPLSNAQLVALACIVVGALGWLWLNRRRGELSPRATA